MIFEIGALKINYETVGRGLPVLILHGRGGHLNTMKMVFEPIFEKWIGFQRFYVDLPGMGKSNAPLEFASSDAILSALTEFVKQKMDAPVLLIGYSYGGYLARALTAKNPERVEGLFLLAPMILPDRMKRQILSVSWYEKFAAEANKKYLSAGWFLADEAFSEALAKHYAVSFDLDSVARQAQFDKASLILLGRQDTVVGFQDQEKLLADYPRATFAVFDMAGHSLQVEQSELLEQLTKNWLERVVADDA